MSKAQERYLKVMESRKKNGERARKTEFFPVEAVMTDEERKKHKHDNWRFRRDEQ